MQIENDCLKIDFGETDKQTAQAMVAEIDSKKSSLFDFFGITKLSNKLHITLYDDFDKFVDLINESFVRQAEFYKKQGIDRPPRKWDEYIVAKAGNGEIDMLNIELCRNKTAHKNTDLQDFLQVAVHEFVHICHGEIITKSPLPNYLLEGIATQLSGQKYYQLAKIDCTAEDLLHNFDDMNKSYHVAYTLMGFMREKFSHAELLDILSGEKKPNIDKLITQANEYLQQKALSANSYSEPALR